MDDDKSSSDDKVKEDDFNFDPSKKNDKDADSDKEDSKQVKKENTKSSK